MKKKKILNLLMGGMLGILVIPSIESSAASYSWDSNIISNYKMISGYTQASNDYCTVKISGTYITTNGKTIIKNGVNASGTRDATTGYATAKNSVPTGGLYFTRLDSVHTVGNNTYKKTVIKK